MARDRARTHPPMRIHALEALGRTLINVRRFSDAIDAALAAVAAEPLRESAHVVLIEAHLAEGNVSEAVRQLERFRSENNLELIEGSPLHFVGSLPPSDHPDLLAVPKSRYRTVDPHRFPDPRTTMRYNRARQSLDRHATYIVAAFLAGAARSS